MRIIFFYSMFIANIKTILKLFSSFTLKYYIYKLDILLALFNIYRGQIT